MNSFIPWIGGKSQLRNKIIGLFPAQQPGMYVEVFGGAGWVLFGRDSHAPVEIFNDIDSNLINLYRCVQHHPEELQRELRLGGEQILVVSRQMFFDYQAQLAAPGLTDIQRAARYYYLIRASFGADRDSFCCTKRSIDKTIDRLPEIQERLRDVVIENRSYTDVIKTYNKPHTLFYLDPPYYRTEGYYQGFTRDDHALLKAALDAIKGQFVLSYNDCPEIRQLCKDYTIHAVQRSNNLANKQGAGAKKYRELIITNY